jgi:hypothetical protein
MAEKLISMKITAADRAEVSSMPAPFQEQYPWGLSITLGEEELEKLGVEKLPKIDGTVTLYAKAKVTRREETQTEGGVTRRTLGLQITELCLESRGKSSADVLYEKKD